MSRVRSRVLLLGVVVFVVVAGVPPAVAQESGEVVGQPDITVSASTVEFDTGAEAELKLALTNRGRIDRGGPEQYEDRVTTARGLTLEVETGDAPIEVNSGSVAVGNVPTGTTAVDPIDVTVPESAEPGTYELTVEYEFAFTRIVRYNENGAEFDDITRRRSDTVTIRVTDQARFEVVDVDSDAQIGDTGDLSIELRNSGTEPASDASVTVTSRSDELVFGTGSGSSTAFAGQVWAPNETRTVDYTVELTDDATLRDYTLSVVVGYTDQDGIDRTSRSLQTGIRPIAGQEFSLQGVSASLHVGEEGTVSGTLVNEGPQPVYDPVVRLRTSGSNFDVVSNEYALADLDPGEGDAFEFVVDVNDAASVGVRQFGLEIEYRNRDGDLRTDDDLVTRVEIVPQRDRFVVEVLDGRIEAGSSTDLRVRVTNNGDEPLSDVEAKAFVNDPLSSDDDEAIVPELAAGDSAEFTIGLSASGSALEKRYPVSFDFQYELPDGDTELSRTYKVAVSVTRTEGFDFPVGVVVGGVAVVGLLGVFAWRRWAR